MKKKGWIAIIIIILLIEPWLVSLIRCEILTAQYGERELIEACEEAHEAIGQIETLKVLDVGPFHRKVYAKNSQNGEVLLLERDVSAEDTRWKVVTWWTVWGKEGNADEYVWPYIR